MPASSQITIRGVSSRLRAALAQQARRRGLSLNRTVLGLLGEATGLADGERAEVREHRELDELAGTWSENEAQAFDEALAQQRTIDPKLWR